jgi:hypothetical protein
VNADQALGAVKGLWNLAAGTWNDVADLLNQQTAAVLNGTPYGLSSLPVATYDNATQAISGGVAQLGVVVAGGIEGATRSGAAETSSGIIENSARGAASESRVLSDIGEVKNTKPVGAAEGKSIPDFQNKKVVGEIKDVKNVSNTRQLRIQKEAAKQSGREHQLYTGTRTRVTDRAAQGTKIIRRDDLGPK